MPRFKFRLTTLLRLREQIRDERRGLLAEAQALEAQLRDQQAALERELTTLRLSLRNSTSPGRINVDRLIDSGRYEMILRGQILALDPQLAAVAAEVDKRRQALIEADRQVKVLEKLREQQQRVHAEDEEEIERKMLDELALIGWRGEEDF